MGKSVTFGAINEAARRLRLKGYEPDRVLISWHDLLSVDVALQTAMGISGLQVVYGPDRSAVGAPERKAARLEVVGWVWEPLDG